MTDFRKIYNLDLLNFVSEFVTDDRKIVLQEKLSLRIKNIRFVSERLAFAVCTTPPA
ncbi:MAG: hypothetical protein MUE53_10060 [Chitinophagales bacterium]|nr:hypothetical protein [Chitinophagales bacterium]